MRRHIPLIVAGLVMTVLLVIQGKSYLNAKRSGILNKRAVIAELTVFNSANKQMRAQLEKEQERIKQLTSQLANESLESEIKTLRKLTGSESITGVGIEVTIDKAVPAFWLTDMIAQLTRAGAEAISINGIRYLDRTAGLREVAGGLMMHTQFIRPPYTISVIGPKEELRDSIAQNGGIIDRLKASESELNIILGIREKIIIGKLED